MTRRTPTGADRDWLLMLDQTIVSAYPSREEAESAMDWYIRTYGAPSGVLWVKEADDA